MASISHFTPCSNNVITSDNYDLCVIGFKPGENLCFQGQAAVCALQGSFTLLGHTLSSPAKKFTGAEPVHFYPAFSPKAYSLLMIESTPYDKRGYRDVPTPQPSTEIKNEIIKVTTKLLKYGPFETIVAIKGIQWCGIDGITSVVPMFKGLFKLFNPNRTEDLAGLTPSKRRKVIQNHPELLEYEFKVPGFYPIIGVPNTPWMRTPENWVDGVQRLIDGVNENPEDLNNIPIIVVCGTKGVGKSTFTRFLSNSLLNEYREIAYLECDIGQSEFTPNGLVSLNLVSNPVFGPPFTHLQVPYRSHFIGNTTPRDDPGHYLNCLRELVNVYRRELSRKIDANGEEARIPLVINTQGWVKNMGLDLLIDLLEYVAPTHIFQFHSPNIPYRNIPADLPKQFVDEMENTREAKIIPLSSVDDITPKYHASDLRTLNLISYMYMNPITYHDTNQKSVWDGSKSWWDFKYPLIARPPYKINWKNLHVSVLFDDVPYSQLLYALNSSVVA
ncbi:Polynucleotide 5'-hydroxyl-kinase grc3 [Basidiobolus ranarum]|uniref:Polynucleotide 5'-hydroxyl-kinase GRC3 n=1 Tax=Basidiobolus ranarum TaxID=34480 RepID=A0ABR2VV11_9FUNG